jgi:AmmeMemoRadiSam system protein B
MQGIRTPVRQLRTPTNRLTSRECSSLVDCADSSKRVFLLGPSHHLYLPNAALSQCKTYETPLGDLVIDTESKSTNHKTNDSDQRT